jgi:transglutaminase-like putative cysteine protease
MAGNWNGQSFPHPAANGSDLEASAVSRLYRWATGRSEMIHLLLYTLLLAAMLTVAAGLSSLVKGLEYLTLAILMTSALILGWILGGSLRRFPVWVLAGLVSGVVVVVIQIGRLVPLIWTWLLAFMRLSVAVTQWRSVGPPDPGPIQEQTRVLIQAITILIRHFGGWLAGLPESLRAFDLIIAALIWSFLVWIVSYWAAGAIRRWRQPLVSQAPAGVLLASSLAFSRGDAAYLVPFLGATLLMLVLLRLGELDHRWSTDEVDYPEEIWVDMGAAGVSAAILFVFLAMASPSFSLRAVFDFVNDFRRGGEGQIQSFAGSLGLENRRDEGGFSQVQYGGLPRRHLLGSGPELRDQIVMTIHKTDLYPEILVEEGADPIAPLYWRSLTYDQYNGRGWETGEPEEISYPAGSVFSSEIPPGYRLVLQEVDLHENLNGLLHQAGTPVTVDAEVVVAWRTKPSADPSPERPERADEGDIFGIQIEARRYQVRSLVPAPGSTELRAAGDRYPQDLLVRYTRLPGSIPDRVLALARDLTITKPTPYDQAIAIESYLREIPYNLDIPAPPVGQDIADYFLFDLREGYCDYYATAMVVLARAAGLPARIVMGYAAGELESESGTYQIAAADAHSWVEVYFPGFGWIEFEPTAGLPPIKRAEIGTAGDSLDLINGLQEEEPSSLNSSWINNLFKPVVYSLGILGILIGIVLMGSYLLPNVRAHQLNRLPPEDAMKRIFVDIYRQAHRLAVPIRPGDTLYEFAASFHTRVGMIVNNPGRRGPDWKFDRELDDLVRLFVRTLFTRPGISKAEQSLAIISWVHLRGILWRVRILQMIDSQRFRRTEVQKTDS